MRARGSTFDFFLLFSGLHSNTQVYASNKMRGHARIRAYLVQQYGNRKQLVKKFIVLVLELGQQQCRVDR